MLSDDLNPALFTSYPPEARELAIRHIELLKQLPRCFAALLLREVIAYDWKFPAERRDLTLQFAYLDSLSARARQDMLSGFSQVRLSPELSGLDLVTEPAQFSERLTAHLWASGQIDVFRAAALDYGQRLDAARPHEIVGISRLVVVIIGQGVTTSSYPLFRKLRKEGVYFRGLKSWNGLQTLLRALAARAAAHPVPFGHWYIDGGVPLPVTSIGVTSVSYPSLDSARAAVLKRMDKVIKSGSGGPELLHEQMAELRPEDIGLSGTGDRAVMNHFQLSLLAEGSGTQLFSTSFVQWAAREALRRAQPMTLLARFAPRQYQRPMGDLISAPEQRPRLDPEGSLIDADMAAYLTWVNQQRLGGADRSSFLAWWEDHSEAVAISPSMPRGTESTSPWDLLDVLRQLT